jgi:hypothetical protein
LDRKVFDAPIGGAQPYSSEEPELMKSSRQL